MLRCKDKLTVIHETATHWVLKSGNTYRVYIILDSDRYYSLYTTFRKDLAIAECKRLTKAVDKVGSKIGCKIGVIITIIGVIITIIGVTL